MPMLVSLFGLVVSFMALQPGGGKLFLKKNGRVFGRVLKMAANLTLLILFTLFLVADNRVPVFVVVEGSSKIKNSRIGTDTTLAFVRFALDQRWPPVPPGQRLVADLYKGDTQVNRSPLDFVPRPPGFSIDNSHIDNAQVKNQLRDGDRFGLTMEIHASGSEFPKLVANLEQTSLEWIDATGSGEYYYAYLGMPRRHVKYIGDDAAEAAYTSVPGGGGGEIVYGREGARTALNVDPSFSSNGRKGGYGVHHSSSSSGGRRYSGASSPASVGGLAGQRQWTGYKNF